MSAGMSLASTRSISASSFSSSLLNFEKSCCLSFSRNALMSGKSPALSVYCCATALNTCARPAMSSSCFFFLPIIDGIDALRWPMMSACTRTRRARFTSSLILRIAELRGSDMRSLNRSSFSALNRSVLSSRAYGFSQNDEMYTRHTSGVWNTLPSDHMSAPYTRISCCGDTMSALLSTTRILSSWPASDSMAALNSSLMSSLCASNSSSMRSARSANQRHTSLKSYERPMRCFSPLSTPGVSMNVKFSSSSLGIDEPANLFKKPVPKRCKPRYGLSACTASALPGITRSSAPHMMAKKRSVVGSGPMFMPGNGVSRMNLRNDVLPVEYWPSSSTVGLFSKSPLVSAWLWNLWNSYNCSTGSILLW
mmetsp:Transcript_7798/g.18594  ORF Transcript_7798/g.18594 Transcript_7798/m.18594 type:complete len:366 (+) Transcript_7798:425-1522(+)